MTDADDAGLGDLYQLRLEADLSSYHWYDCEENRYLLWNRERALNLLDRIESQRREIEELRRELAEAKKYAAGGASPAKFAADYSAASAFAAKHGGRDG